MAEPVIVVDYNPNWPFIFQLLRTRIAEVLGDAAAAIEHVGSTAVPNLAAKPVIDIDVLLTSENILPVVITRLARLGYVHQGNQGVPDRESFLAPPGDPPHRLYVCPPRSVEYRRHLAFRNYLRAHPADAKVYSELKMALAGHQEDRAAYSKAKAEFVQEVTGRAVGGTGE